MSIVQFAITHENGARQRIAVDSERILIGSGAHCDVRLPPRACEGEHVSVDILGDVLHFTALGARPPPMLNGNPLTETTVHGTAVIGIGGLSIQVAPSDETGPAVVPTKVAERRFTVVGAMAASLLLFLAVGTGVVMLRARRAATEGLLVPPELFAKPIEACPVGDVDQALAAGNEKRIAGDGKRERHPFVVADGVEAVALYETAGACFAKANEAALADEMSATAAQLRAEVIDDYRVRRLRLERALARDDKQVATQELRALRSLMAGKSGDYADWIDRTARNMEIDKESP